MIRKLYVFIVVFMTFTFLHSQMTEGFNYLENGDFEKAESFFFDYLKTDPNNKTAKLCYARAVGLSGEPDKATSLFKDLLIDYPEDFEILINYNESFLWSKKYKQAKPLYENLLKKYPKEFGAVLGYANTLSNLKQYEMALEWIEKAIALDSTNKSARTSRKYIRLGYANKFVNNQEYDKGEKLLLHIFEDYPEDKDALLNLANLYLITKEVDLAKATYWRYATTQKDTVIARNGISLAEHIGEKDKEALKVATRNLAEVKSIDDFELTERTKDRYVQALIWNGKFSKAQKEIRVLEEKYGTRDWLSALKATLGLYTGDPKSSISQYDAILQNDSTSFDGNLGKANALFAADKIMPAYQMAFKTLDYYKNQKDALGFIEKLDLMHLPNIQEHGAFTFDNGKNQAYFTHTTVEIPWSTKFRTHLSYMYRSTQNTASGNEASSHVLLTGLQYKLLPKTNIKLTMGLNNSISISDRYSQPVIDAQLQLQPFKLQNLNLGYQREIQNFNADLIEREIVQNHYGLNYNLGTNFNLGWYTQAMYTLQSDENVRNLLFTSLYYTLLKKPAIKMGVNYQYITFKDQVPTIYFSPEQYQAFEIFADVRGEFSKKLDFMASAATGIQKVEEDPDTNIFRAELGLQYEVSNYFNFNIYGKYSNIASATAAGFEFSEVGLKFKWMFIKQPLYKKRVGQ